MARYRMIKPEFWDDQKVATKLSDLAKLLYIGSWNFSDDYGVIKGHPLWIKNNIFPYDERPVSAIADAIEELIALDRFRYFEVDGEDYYFIQKFTLHQTINRPSQTRNPEPPKDFNNKVEDDVTPKGKNMNPPNTGNTNHGAIPSDSANTHGVLTEGSSPKHKHKEKYKRSISINAHAREDEASVNGVPKDMPFVNAFDALAFTLQHYAVGQENKKISKAKAKKIADKYQDEFIFEKITHLNWILKHKPGLAKNPPAYLVKSIESHYPPPAGYEEHQDHMKRKAAFRSGETTSIGDLIAKSLASPG